MKTNNITLGDVIKHYRDQRGLTMQEFANLSGMSKAYVSRLENGTNPSSKRPVVPSIETYGKVAKAMKITVNELLEMVGNEELVEVPGTLDDKDKLLLAFEELNEENKAQLLTYLEFLKAKQ